MLTSGSTRRNWANVQRWFRRAMLGIRLNDRFRGHQRPEETGSQADLPQGIQSKTVDPKRCPDSTLAKLPVHPNPEPGHVTPRLPKAADPQERSPLAIETHP